MGCFPQYFVGGILSTDRLSFLNSRNDQALDAFFGVQPITDVPREGHEGLYLHGLTTEALYSSYHDVAPVMEWLYAQGARSWCDIGCGAGRTPLLWSWLHPEARGIGIEIVPERVEAARAASRHSNLNNVQWMEGDFASPSLPLPEADVFFIYLATGPSLDALLEKIKRMSRASWVVVVESHGDLCPRLEWESWWLQPHAMRFPLRSQRHDPWVRLYRTRSVHAALALERSWEMRAGVLPSELLTHPSPLGYLLSKSYLLHWELVIGEGEEMWTMDTLGLKWHDHQTVQGIHPPRQVVWGRGTLVGLRHVPQDGAYGRWARLRRNGTKLRVRGLDASVRSGLVLRKIMLAPREILEFSDGSRLEWNQLASMEVIS